MGIGHGDRHDDHLRFIRQLPCPICGTQPCEAAHVRFSDAATGKVSAVGVKPGDEFTVPLCSNHHRLDNDAQHRRGEREFWMHHRINPLALARRLFEVSPDTARGELIARQARRLCPWSD